MIPQDLPRASVSVTRLQTSSHSPCLSHGCEGNLGQHGAALGHNRVAPTGAKTGTAAGSGTCFFMKHGPLEACLGAKTLGYTARGCVVGSLDLAEWTQQDTQVYETKASKDIRRPKRCPRQNP